jgi:hypothetical protein
LLLQFKGANNRFLPGKSTGPDDTMEDLPLSRARAEGRPSANQGPIKREAPIDISQKLQSGKRNGSIRGHGLQRRDSALRLDAEPQSGEALQIRAPGGSATKDFGPIGLSAGSRIGFHTGYGRRAERGAESTGSGGLDSLEASLIQQVAAEEPTIAAAGLSSTTFLIDLQVSLNEGMNPSCAKAMAPAFEAPPRP